jgi:hypothetical protein
MQPGVQTKGYDPATITKAKEALRNHLGFESETRVELREEIEQRFGVDGTQADVIYDLLWSDGGP